MVAKTDLLVQIRARDRATPSIKNLQSTIIRFVGAVSAAIAGLSTVAFPVKQAAEFEKGLRAVQKTTGFVDEDIKRLGNSLSELSTELVTTAPELAQIAAVAGQLGLGSEGAKGVEDFTKTVAIAATALDITADTAATAGARIANIFQLDVGQVQNVFSAINELSNTTTANGEQLIDVIQRIGATAGLAFEQSSALAATAIDLGVSQEVAGTSLAKVFSRLQSETEDFAEALGVSIGEFIGLGALERFQLFISTLAGQSEQLRAQNIRELAGGGRIFVTIDKFVNDAAAGGLALATNLNTANQSFEDGTSAVKEYEIQTNTLLSSLQLLGNSFTKLSRDVGAELLTKLSDLALELAEFFKTDDAKEFGRVVSEQFSSTLDAIEGVVRAFAEADINFQNVIATIKVFIALGLVKILKSIILSTALWNAQLLVTLGRWTGINRLLVLFGVASASSLGVTTFSIANLGRALATFAFTLLRLIPVIAIVSGVGFLIVKGLEAAGVEFGVLGRQIGDFFGFVSTEQSKAARAAAEERASALKDIEEANALIREGQQALAENRFGTRGQVVPIRFDAEGSTEEFNRQVQQAIGGLATLEQAEQAVGDAIVRNRDESEKTIEFRNQQVELAQKLRAAIAEVSGAERRSTLFNRQEADAGVLAAVGEDADTASIDNLNRRLEIVVANISNANAEIGALQTVFGQLQGAGEDFSDETDKLTRKLAESFDLSTNKALESRVALEATFRAQQAATEALTATEKELNELSDAGLSAVEQAAKREELKKLQDEQQATFLNALEANNKAKAQFDQALANAGENAEAVIKAAEPAIKGLADDGIGQLTTALQAVPREVEQASRSMTNLEQRTKAFGLEMAELQVRKRGVEAARDAVEDLAKSAQGAFDNTNKTIRAFRRSVLEAVRDIRASIGERVFTLRAEIRNEELDSEIKDLQDRRAEVEAAGQKRIDDARLDTEKAYFKRRLDENLEAIDRELNAVEVRRGFIEERNLRNRLDRLKARSDEFIRLAQQAAASGDVDQALGLSAAARNATKEIGNVIDELTNLETFSASGDRIFQLREGEILNLISDFQDQEKRVSQALPGINRTLQEVTQANLTAINSTLSTLNTSIAALSAEIQKTANLLGERGAEFQKNVVGATNNFVKIIDRTGAAQPVSATDIASGAVGTAEAAALVESNDKAIQAEGDNTAALNGLTGALNQSRTRVFFNNPDGTRTEGTLNRAEGGIIRGPGTSKSDSILARLSRDEFVVNAATTRRFGSGFFYGLQALAKRGKGLSQLPGFATGGLGLGSFEPVVQAMGTGGAPVHIHLPGGDTMRLREGEDDTLTVKRIAKREALKRGSRVR
jgi:TP901 family phage tail tape measure protein